MHMEGKDLMPGDRVRVVPGNEAYFRYRGLDRSRPWTVKIGPGELLSITDGTRDAPCYSFRVYGDRFLDTLEEIYGKSESGQL